MAAVELAIKMQEQRETTAPSTASVMDFANSNNLSINGSLDTCNRLCFLVTLTDIERWSEPRPYYWNSCDNSSTTSVPSPPADCLMPLSIETSEMNDYTEFVYGRLAPAVVGFTCVTNLLICVVLLKKHMRTPANCLLVAMALADLLTGLSSLPCFIHFYTLGHFRDWVPYSWCTVYVTLVDYLPTTFHTASIWLTTALATQRYVHVCEYSHRLVIYRLIDVYAILFSIGTCNYIK